MVDHMAATASSWSFCRKPRKRNDRSLVAIQMIGGRMHDVWIADDAAKDGKYKQPNEDIHFRYWSGREVLPSGNDQDG